MRPVRCHGCGRRIKSAPRAVIEFVIVYEDMMCVESHCSVRYVHDFLCDVLDEGNDGLEKAGCTVTNGIVRFAVPGSDF